MVKSPWEAAKCSAIACMFLNHVGLALPQPWPEIGVGVGRICLPIFSLLIVFNLRDETEARAGRYLTWLLGWALVSQPVYALLFNSGFMWRLNALATLATGVTLIYISRVYGMALAVTAACVVINQTEWLEGGAWMPVGQLLAWYLLSKKPTAKLFAICTISILAYGMNTHGLMIPSLMGAIAVFATPLVMAASAQISAYVPRQPRLFFYAFYPLHLTAIFAVHGPIAA